MASSNKKINSTPSSHDEEAVTLARSYGVRKRVTWVTHMNNIIAAALAVIMIVFFGAIAIAGIVWLVLMLGAMGIALAAVGAVLFIYFVVCRKLRKRIKFLIRLKRKCKQLGYKLEFRRGLFKGLRFNNNGIDFIVDTNKKRWCVRFMTPKKHLSHYTFIDKNTIEVKTNIVTSRFKFVLGMNDPRVKRISYSFDDNVSSGYKKVAKALILNPVPHDAFKKDADGAVVPIGTGEYLYGYTMFSGSGFIQTLQREDDI